MPTLELTEEQIKHVQLLLKQSQPSRTLLTADEKAHNVHFCKGSLEELLHYNAHDADEENFNNELIELNKSIIKKLK